MSANANVVATSHPFVEALVRGGRALPESPVSWLNTRRALALERANALDFDDMILMAHQLLSEHPDVLEKYQRRWAHVLVDEVYLDAANLVAGGTGRPKPAATLDGPFLSTNSLTKSYGLAGLRCGWVVAPPDVASRVRRTRDVVDNAESAPADRLAALAFGALAALADRARAILGGNLARARAFFAEHPELELSEAPAASVVFPRLLGLADASPFVRRLLDDHGVAVAPGHFFDLPAHFRLSLAGRPETLERGLERLTAALE